MIEHIYIHWPFCRSKCFYCDFASFVKNKDFMIRYHNKLCDEIRTFKKNVKNPKKIKTIFLGGGTPSIYPLDLLQELFDVLKDENNQNFLEATIEVNPETVTEKHLRTWKSVGINRLSIGVQILDKDILKTVNRFQTNRSVINLLKLAPKYFDNISVDLILGLPGTTTKIWFDTLKFLTFQPIKHISIYFLTLYEKTPLYKKVKEKTIKLPDEEWLIKTYEKTIDFLEQRNFLQYEISNFSKPEFESIHNKAYWSRTPYQGFGLSAASFDGKKRLVNSKNLLEYLNCTKASLFTQEVLTPENVFLEELMLGLRQKCGMDLQRVVYFLKEDTKEFFEKLSELTEKGLIRLDKGRIFLTVRGMVLENEIIKFLV